MILWASIEIKSDTLCYDIKNKCIEAKGHVKVDYKGKVLLCDQLHYDQKTHKMNISGQIQIDDENKNQLVAQKIYSDLEFKEAIAEHFEILIQDSFFFRCKRGVKKNAEYIFEKSYFTACEVRNPLWSIDAKKIVYDEKKDRVYHYDGFLKIKNTRVFPIPYFSHVGPNSKRGKGFLPPFINPVSRDLGFIIGLSYYYPFSHKNDATVTPYYVSEYGLGVGGEYRHNFDRGHFQMQSSFLKRLRNKEEFVESKNWHAYIEFEKKSKNHLIDAQFKRASDPDYLKKFWFLHDKGILYHDPLISNANYSCLWQDGYLNTSMSLIQNRNEKNPKYITPSVDFEWNKYNCRFNTKFFYLDQKGGFSLNRLEWSKTFLVKGMLMFTKTGCNFIFSKDKKNEVLPTGTMGVSYPLIHKDWKVISEPILIVNASKPFEENYDEIFLKPFEESLNSSLFYHKHNVFFDKKLSMIFGFREKFIEQGINVFVGGVKSNDEKIKGMLELSMDVCDHFSLYASTVRDKEETSFFEGGMEIKSRYIGVQIGTAHIKNLTQYNLDLNIYLTSKWALRFGYIGNLKFSNESKFLQYASVYYENECCVFEVGFSLDKMIRSFRSKKEDHLDYKILLQISPKFSREKRGYQRYLPGIPLI